MDLVTGAMGKLPGKLLELLKDEYKLQSGVRPQVEFLSRELESIHVALCKVAQVPTDKLDPQVKLWVRDVREESYDMEDVLDKFLVRVDGVPQPAHPDRVKRLRVDVVPQHADQNWLQKFLTKMGDFISNVKARHEIAGAIEGIKKQLEEMAERRARYRVDELVAKPAAATSIDPRLSALYTNASLLVGMEGPRDALIEMLSVRDGDVPNMETKIVSVVGLGGLGKTTLAKAVHEKLKEDVHYKAFVPVGRNPDLKKVLKDILIDLDKQRYTTGFNFTILDERQLINELREFLKDKRYFIVIDDIWDVESWNNTIRYALYDNNLGSKIIITTRICDVADKVGGSSYTMEPLPLESSKILFYGRIFGSEDKCPLQLLEVSEKILKKCGGVPLAIITTSSLLANKSRNIEEWHAVCVSIGSGLGNNSDMDNMRKILSLSYYDLPSHLKTCLLSLSIYPEDFKIRRNRLILRWLAEDFVVHGEGGQSLFEVGESYFNELVNRSLIQTADMNDEGIPEDPGIPGACHVHDMVLDLICSLSREENFITISKDIEQNKSSGNKVRRLSLQNTTWPTTDMSQVRSLTAFGPDSINSMPPLSCFTLLRVLDLEDCNLIIHLHKMSFVGNLFHLRYLGLRGTNYTGELPEEIGKLQFLQTLDLRWTSIKELPSSIVGLKQLMYLYVDEEVVLPNGVRNLTSLQLLSKATVTKHSAYLLEELGHLTQLRELGIFIRDRLVESGLKALVGSLSKLRKIERLVICGLGSRGADLMREGWVPPPCLRLFYLGSEENIDATNRFATLPTWIHPASLFLLASLHVWVDEVRPEDIQVLGILPALRVLILGVSKEIQVEERFMLSADTFPCLRWCNIFGFGILPSMFPQGAMPRLERFYFQPRLSDFVSNGGDYDDLAMGHLPSLQLVRVALYARETVSHEVVEKVEEKLRHEADVHPNQPYIGILRDIIDYEDEQEEDGNSASS